MHRWRELPYPSTSITLHSSKRAERRPQSHAKSTQDLGPLSSEKLLSLRALGNSFWLDSGGGGPLAVCSFAGAGPTEILEARGTQLRRFYDGSWSESIGDPLDALDGLWQRARLRHPPKGRPRPLCVGYLTYDLGALTQGISLPQRPALPSLYFASYDAVYAFDHETQRGSLLGEDTEVLRRALSSPVPLPPRGSLSASIDTTRAQYGDKLSRIKEHLLDGDIYQANLSLGLQTHFEGDPLSLYDQLRAVACVPFGAYLEDGHGAVLSASMERFLRGYALPEGLLVETRPIKGTRPRHPDPARDQAEREALLASAKDHAEHVMIVDLERNDLGRLAFPGAVEVTEFCALTPHPTVFHLESTVRALLPSQTTLSQLLGATFPTGSITGAPKRRAMEIIAQLEGQARGVYCGAIGYLDDHGGFDLSVAIRTAELRGQQLTYRAGGGIVADSDEEQEWQECAWKAAAFVRALGS